MDSPLLKIMDNINKQIPLLQYLIMDNDFNLVDIVPCYIMYLLASPPPKKKKKKKKNFSHN